MIVIDTNIILASIRQPVTSADEGHHTQATQLLSQVAAGTVQALVPEVVLHECFYVLVMRDRQLSVEDFSSLFRRFLDWPGWAMRPEELDVFMRALDIVEAHPKLEFSDAVIAARAEVHDAELATFDQRLAKAFDGKIWTAS